MFSVRTVGKQRQRQIVGQVEGSIGIGCISFDRACFGPARIIIDTDRTVVLRFFRTGTDTDRVIHGDVVIKQFVKPVRVSHFGHLKVSGTCFGGIFQSPCLGLRIIIVDELVHLSINSAIGGPVSIREDQPAFFCHFIVNTHLFLRIHYVEIVIVRFQAGCEFTGIVDPADTGLSSLCGDSYYARHGSGTVYGGSRTVFQNLKTFDIVGTQSGYCRTDQGDGVAGRQVISVDFNGIFHDNAIDHP